MIDTLRAALDEALTTVEQGIARSPRPDREGFLMTSHIRQLLAAHPEQPALERKVLDREMLFGVARLTKYADEKAKAPQPDPSESKNIRIPAAGAAQAYKDMANRLTGLDVLAWAANIGVEALTDLARYARTQYETPITYTRDEQALRHSGRCKAYLDMAERLETLVNGDKG